jgi:hypothetical protein
MVNQKVKVLPLKKVFVNCDWYVVEKKSLKNLWCVTSGSNECMHACVHQLYDCNEVIGIWQ